MVGFGKVHAARAEGLLDPVAIRPGQNVGSAHVDQPEDGEGDRNRYQDVEYDGSGQVWFSGSKFFLGGCRFFLSGFRFLLSGSRFFLGIRCLEIHLSIYRFGARASSMMVLVME